jgi:hypothetical protein
MGWNLFRFIHKRQSSTAFFTTSFTKPNVYETLFYLGLLMPLMASCRMEGHQGHFEVCI